MENVFNLDEFDTIGNSRKFFPKTVNVNRKILSEKPRNIPSRGSVNRNSILEKQENFEINT